MSKNIQATIWAGVALLMVVIGTWAVKRQLPVRAATLPVTHKVSKPTSIAETLTNIFMPNVATTSKATKATTTAATTAVTTGLYRKPKAKTPPMPSYGDMVAQYQNTRIQFGPDCQAHPNQIAIANPVTLMLDNRSDTAQKITIGKVVYNVAAYNYVIATVNEKVLPVNVFIDCNQQTNAVEILLQK